ncbi:MAG: FHA domain-containing protein [Lachnospiraceae bacterium]|nr:FHA domain-containing protein [Lachnospiraceae bacterium]
MKYSYRHEAAGNYLIINGKDTINADDYRIMMFKKNKLKRFLELKVNYVDNEAEYYYKISSKQSLKQLFDSKKIKYDDMITIVTGISEAVNELEKYLLNPESLVLEPENIYLNPVTKEPEFCYNPECDVGILEGIRELLRYFLKIIDNSDKKTVEFAYDIYCRAMQDEFSLDNILEGTISDNMDYTEYGSESSDIKEDAEDLPNDIKQHKSVAERIVEFFGRLLRKPYNTDKNFEEESLCDVSTFMDDNEEEKTELLGISKYDYRLISTHGNSIIEISEFPYVIGKLPDQVNEIIYSDKVSRLHAKIIMEENKIYIMDMNSKNVTYINGIRIFLYEKKELYSGDKVRFADMEYIYQQVH